MYFDQKAFADPPYEEPARQNFFIEKCRSIIEERNSGRSLPLTACPRAFGCQMNARDTEKLAGILQAVGFNIVDDDGADLVIYDTCTVRENADERVFGRLGFLADISRDEVTAAIDDIYAGHYTIEEHAVICVDCEGTPIPGSPFALNDIAVLKRDDASMISIRTSVDNDYLVTYQADGLVVSTPTGSTAYSLSNGGPIVWPRADVLCLTPVAPHSMNIRPMVLPDTSVITLDVVSRSHQFLVAVDGRSARCTEGTTLTIRRAAYTIHILKRQGQTYFRTLREKMMWGKDVR